MLSIFEAHVKAELDGDLETTMATMSDNPHLHNVPSLFGGYGIEVVRKFYQNHFVGKFFPPDVTMERVSLTIGEDQLVEELIISFTHTTVIDWMLPHVKPTNKIVEVAFVVIVGFRDEKVAYEHIYWDQACALVQVGLLDPTELPVTGHEGVRIILDPSLPTRVV